MRGGAYLFSPVLALALASAALAGGQATLIRQVDFKNFEYAWSTPVAVVPSSWQWLTSPTDKTFTTVNGIHHFFTPGHKVDEGQAALISVDSVTYGDLDADGVEEAAVALNYSEGGTANWDYVYVYRMERRRPALMVRMQTGSRADGGLVKLAIKDGVLLIDFADADRRRGDCCSEGYIRVSYRWERGGFVEIAPRKRGNLQ
jgi:hypothetical protein